MVVRSTLCLTLFAALVSGASAQAGSTYQAYRARAEKVEAELAKYPEKLKFRHNSTKVIRLWSLALNKARRGTERRLALQALSTAWARLAHWSGRSADKAEAAKRQAQIRGAVGKNQGISNPPKTARRRARQSVPKGSALALSDKRLPRLVLEMVEDALHVVLPVSHQLSVKRHHIPARKGRGHRVYFDVSPLVAGLAALKMSMVEHASVRKLRVGQFDADTVRFVFDVEPGKSLPGVLEFRTGDVPRFVLAEKRKPVRTIQVAADQKALNNLVADLKREEAREESRGKKRASSKRASLKVKRLKKKQPAAMPKISTKGLRRSTRRAIAPRSNSELMQIRRIVIDPGHGGKDHGATCAKTGKEKDVNLAIAKKLGRTLAKEMGVKVIYTRTTDVFISLKRRVEIANQSGADLFISVHANAHSSAKVKGIETYYLNTTSNEYAKRLAHRENQPGLRQVPVKDVKPGVGVSGEDEGQMPKGKMGRDVQLLLADLAMKSATGESRRLAGYVQSSIIGRLRGDYPGVRDLGVKKAIFFVLLGVRMPSILIESGFMSNPMEAKRLGNAAYQSEMARAIAFGVKRFVWERRQLAQNL